MIPLKPPTQTTHPILVGSKSLITRHPARATGDATDEIPIALPCPHTVIGIDQKSLVTSFSTFQQDGSVIHERLTPQIV